MTSRKRRKDEHISIALTSVDGPSSSGFEDIYFINDSVSELNFEEIELSLDFLHKRLQYPLVINALTGGTNRGRLINENLAILANKYKIAMAVGSQTIALEDPGLRDSFTAVRDINPEGLVFANVGMTVSYERALQAVEMIAADALQVHFNIPQELAMVDGDRNFRGVINNIENIVKHCPVPIIAKEVGFGFSSESIIKLYHAGVRIFDVGGKGGTNFIVIEDKRDGLFDGELDDWGIPSAVSLAEAVSCSLPIQTIASGGIRTACDVAKALSMGSDLVGMAGPLLRSMLEHGVNDLDKKLETLIYRLKSVFIMTGAKNIREIRQKPLIIIKETADWLRVRGIEPEKWSRANRI